jgi:hypothetical protein
MQPFGGSPQRDGHLQRPDRQVTFHPVADSPADDAPGMQIEDDSQIEPALLCPDIADVARPFLVGRSAEKSRFSRFGAMLKL